MSAATRLLRNPGFSTLTAAVLMMRVAMGCAIGAAAAALLARALRGFLYGVAPVDPATFALVPALLLATAVLAAALASLRAARLDPAQALRH